MSKVTLETVRETKEKFDFSVQVLAKQVIRTVLLMEKCPLDVYVTLTLTGDEDIRVYNREYRGIDRATDVLSFPGIPLSSESDWDEAQKMALDCQDPDTGLYFLGDIILNAGQVYRQAEEYGHSVKREFAFLIAHSTLHLCGYDHMVDEERIIMEEKQEQALSKLGIVRFKE